MHMNWKYYTKKIRCNVKLEQLRPPNDFALTQFTVEGHLSYCCRLHDFESMLEWLH